MKTTMKKSRKQAIAFILCLLMAFTLAACGDGGSGSSKNGELLATVNGTEIWEAETTDFAKVYLMASYGYKLSDLESMGEDIKNTFVNGSCVDILIDFNLMKEYLKDVEVITKEKAEQTEAALDNLKADATYGPIIESENIPDSALKMFYELMDYQTAFIDKLNEEIPVTEDEIAAYYEEHKTEFTTPGSVDVSHILVTDSAIAEEVLAKAKAGDDFAELVKEYSTDTASVASGGALGLTSTDTLVEEFADAALKLKKGEISDIVQSTYGYHIIKANADPIQKQQMTLEESRAAVTQIIQGNNQLDKLAELRENADIKYYKGIDPATVGSNGSIAGS
jgi:foldase protein PrsA